MTDKNRMTRVLLVVYAIGSVAVAIPLLLSMGHTGELADTTSGKILAGAILSLGLGAALAARDPWRNRIMIQVLIAFTALSSLAIAYRVGFEHYVYDPAWVLLPLAITASVALAIFYPRRPSD